ncbi:MAG: hypothetical protein ACXVCY_17015 [Pseudobdellovibrionaceae bacterium]
MLKSISGLLLFVGILIQGTAFAEPWSHVPAFQSAEGNTIHIDYIVNYYESHDYKPYNLYFATPLYVNVSGPSLTGNEKIRVVLSNYDGYSAVPITYTLDLSWQGTHFSGEISNSHVNQSYIDYGTYTNAQRPIYTKSTGYGGTHIYSQVIAVVIDGHWQNFDVMGNTNHVFNLDYSKTN